VRISCVFLRVNREKIVTRSVLGLSIGIRSDWQWLGSPLKSHCRSSSAAAGDFLAGGVDRGGGGGILHHRYGFGACPLVKFLSRV
jgi:hypothetical protein